MTHERDEVWGAAARRPLTSRGRSERSFRPEPRTFGADSAWAPTEAGAADPHGPEAVARARKMDYELTTQIQQESPYVYEEVVEHRVHDYRLFVGMWVVAGVSGVAAFLTYSLVHLGITALAVAFALTSSPGRSRYED